jgi:hypothetical protein
MKWIMYRVPVAVVPAVAVAVPAAGVGEKAKKNAKKT